MLKSQQILWSLGESIEHVKSFDASLTPEELVKAMLKDHSTDTLDVPMVLMDLGAVIQRFNFWKQHMPNVEPWYAVKCNPDPKLISLLISLGVRFDCATPLEMNLVRSLGHPSEDIVYAHPTKPISHLKEAKAAGVSLTVFDNETELVKLANIYPEAKLLIRIAPIDDSKAQCPMSIKFGAPPAKVRDLLAKARELSANVIGVHFHVGSGCTDATAYRLALHEARRVFDTALEFGYTFSLLDIGGGFPGCDDQLVRFEDIAYEVNQVLPVLFPGIRVIAEPGRFFATSVCTLVTRIISKASHMGKTRYHLNDGLYGSFNCLLYDHATLSPPWSLRQGKPLAASIFGPTCDGFDKITEDCLLPDLEVGDLVVWNKMGAYTTAAATNFNGFAIANYQYYYST